MSDIVMITGAAGQLGRAVAAAFAAAGYRRVLVDLKREDLERVHGAEGDAQCYVAANLLEQAAVDAAVRAGTERYGRIDVLVNVAGGFTMGEAVHETTDATWNQMFGMNALSTLHTARAVVPGMLARGGGRIVSVAANTARHGEALKSAYGASKATVVHLTEAMADELRDRGINVNCVLPTTLDTPPNRAAMPDADRSRWVAPADLAQVILFLASPAGRAIHGAALKVG